MAAPRNPRMTPASLYLVRVALKIKMPMSSVHIGVRLLSRPATELLIRVWAKKNRNAGMPLPVRPTARNFSHRLQLISFLWYHTIGEKAKADIPILKQASCTGVKATSDFLMRIKEQPHTSVKKMSIAHEALSSVDPLSMILI